MSIHGIFQTVPLEGTALALRPWQWGCPALVLPLEWELWAGQGLVYCLWTQGSFLGCWSCRFCRAPRDFMAWSSGFSH